MHGNNSRWQWADTSNVNYFNWAPGGDRHCTGKGDCGVGMWLTKDEKFGTWVAYDDGIGPDGGKHPGWEPMLCYTYSNF
ncbi:hypothetical protein AAVH_26133 [Aphelenchoides avenae]|nr:hypothetical protein AAVH_26133 [Aphelenchus avenae]